MVSSSGTAALSPVLTLSLLPEEAALPLRRTALIATGSVEPFAPLPLTLAALSTLAPLNAALSPCPSCEHRAPLALQRRGNSPVRR